MKPNYSKPLVHFYLLTLLPLSCVVLGGLLFNEFVVHAITTNVILNTVIIGAMLMGAFLMLYRVHFIISEWRLMRFLMRLRDADTVNDKQISAALQNRHLKSRRLMDHLLQLKDMRIVSMLDKAKLDSEFEAMQEWLEHKLELPQYWVGLMIGLGLLGTFIGLLDTLVGIANLIAGFSKAPVEGADIGLAFRSLISNLQHPLSSMGIAFSASMFGLIGSIVLGFMLLTVRFCQGHFLEYVRNQIAHWRIESGSVSQHAVAAGDASDLSWLRAAVGELFDNQRRLNDVVFQQAEWGQANERRQAALMTAIENSTVGGGLSSPGGSSHLSVLPQILLALENMRTAFERSAQKEHSLVLPQLVQALNERAAGVDEQLLAQREALAKLSSLVTEGQQQLQQLAAWMRGPTTQDQQQVQHEQMVREFSRISEMLEREFKLMRQSIWRKADGLGELGDLGDQ